MNRSQFFLKIVFLIVVSIPAALPARDFSGGGGSIYFGTGSPNSIAAVTNLANDLEINDARGNYIMGIQGFFQNERYRLGGIFQGHAWGSVNLKDEDAKDDATGVAALVGGLYSSYTFRNDRILLNTGIIVGAGRCFMGYNLGEQDENRYESVTTFYIEPQASLGVASCRWFAIEFQLSTPIFIFTEELKLDRGEQTYAVNSSDLLGLNFSIKLTSGKIANP